MTLYAPKHRTPRAAERPPGAFASVHMRDMVMFGRDIKPLSFVLSAVLTVVFSLLVNLGMKRKLRNISMVESMKAPE